MISHSLLVQFSHSVVSNFLWPLDCSTSGFPLHHQLPELTQPYIHWVSDAIQPSHPLLSPSPPAFSLSQHQGLFQWVSSSYQVPVYWSVSFSISPSKEYSGLIFFRTDWLDLLAVQGSLLAARHSQESSLPPQFRSISSWMLSFLHSPTLTFIHNYWKNHSFDCRTFVGKVMSLLFNVLFRLVIAFLLRNKCLLISHSI